MFLGPVEPLGKTPEQKFHLSNDVLLGKRKKKKKKIPEAHQGKTTWSACFLRSPVT